MRICKWIFVYTSISLIYRKQMKWLRVVQRNHTEILGSDTLGIDDCLALLAHRTNKYVAFSLHHSWIKVCLSSLMFEGGIGRRVTRLSKFDGVQIWNLPGQSLINANLFILKNFSLSLDVWLVTLSCWHRVDIQTLDIQVSIDSNERCAIFMRNPCPDYDRASTSKTMGFKNTAIDITLIPSTL